MTPTTTPTTFTAFTTTATDPLTVGSDALLYVMAYGHGISVATAALEQAQHVAVLSIARRDTPEPVLRDVNRAIDVIGATIRTRQRLDAEAAQVRELMAAAPAPQVTGGTRVPAPRRPTPLAPVGSCASPF
jgi:hypothetical protein